MPPSCNERGYSILPELIFLLFWVLFEELLRRNLWPSPWASVPAGLVACVAFFWLAGSVVNAIDRLLGTGHPSN